MTRRSYLHRPLLWLASLVLGTCLIEGVLWVRHRINAGLQAADRKLVQDTRVADALWELVEEGRSHQETHIFICKRFPKLGQQNWSEWLKTNSECTLAE